MKKILIINGPNLNLLGKRETTIYGEISLEEYYNSIKEKYTSLSIRTFQSNAEEEIVQEIQQSQGTYDGIVINPGALGHLSLSIADAIAAVQTECIEVHISNIYARENFRHYTLISSVCKGTISGFGLKSYELALQYFV